MILNKYSGSKDGTTIGAYVAPSSKGSGSSSSSSNKTVGLDREIWGQEDDGGDLDGDLTCGGNIYIIDNYDDSEDDDEDVDEYVGAQRKPMPISVLSAADELSSKFDNDEGGNLYVKRQLVVDGRGDFKAIQYQSGYNLPDTDDSSKLASTEWVNKKIAAHKTLTINDSTGKELGKFDNTEDKTVTVKNYDGDISGINNNITNINNDITEINNKLDQIAGDIPQIDINAPVILFSGIIHSNNDDGGTFGNYQPWVVRPLMYAQHTGVDKLELNYLEVDGQKKCTLVVKVIAKEGWKVKPLSVNAICSLNRHCNPTSDFGGNRRSQGYWMTGGVLPHDGNIYLQVWRTHDDNNDSTINDQIAYSAQEINLTIFGTSYKNS